jgi:hypothetical protein
MGVLEHCACERASAWGSRTAHHPAWWSRCIAQAHALLPFQTTLTADQASFPP